MTHILIPIADIEEKIEEYKNLKLFGYTESEANRSIHELNLVLGMGKQISFDEKDIDEKIKASQPPLTFIAGEYHGLERSQGFQRGYKKAIKDLL